MAIEDAGAGEDELDENEGAVKEPTDEEADDFDDEEDAGAAVGVEDEDEDDEGYV